MAAREGLQRRFSLRVNAEVGPQAGDLFIEYIGLPMVGRGGRNRGRPVHPDLAWAQASGALTPADRPLSPSFEEAVGSGSGRGGVRSVRRVDGSGRWAGGAGMRGNSIGRFWGFWI